MSLEYNYIDPNTTSNRLVGMIIKAHYYDILTYEQLQNLTEIVEMSIKRATDNTASINISTYSELLDNKMKHIETPIMFISKNVGMMTPPLSWVQSYSYMYDHKNDHKNEQSNNMIVMIAVKCDENVRVTKIRWIR